MFDEGRLAQMTYIREGGSTAFPRFVISVPRSDGTRTSKSISSSKYGREIARRMAMFYRNFYWKQINGYDYPGMEVEGKGRGATGMCSKGYQVNAHKQKTAPAPAGVSRCVGAKRSASGHMREHPRWTAQIQVGPPDDRRTRCKSWAVGRHGEANAKAKAIEWREQQLKKERDLSNTTP